LPAVVSHYSGSKVQSPQIIPSGEGCGAEVQGVDLAAPGPIAVSALQQAVRDHLAIVVRGQPVSEAQLLALGQAFGTLEAQGVSVLGTRDPETRQAHLVVSNRMNLERPTGSLGAGGSIWQSDLSYRMRPCSIAILHAQEISAGSGIAFANQYRAWEALPEDLRAGIEKRMLLHDESTDNEGRLRKGFAEVCDPREATGAQHRLVRTHPDTRRKTLYLGRRRNAYVIGLALEQSEQLLDRLWAHATQPGLLWTHHWQAGDTLIWDNRCVIYRHDLAEAGTSRLMFRVQVRGEIPG
jgi:taurine dioxygenase